MSNNTDTITIKAIDAALERAVDLAVDYGIDAVKINFKMGPMYLVNARKTRGGVNASYLSQARIVNEYHAALAAHPAGKAIQASA